MIAIPYVIAAIEDESDREFMEGLFLEYQRLMYYEIRRIIDDQWLVEDVLQTTLEKLINNLETIRALPTRKLVNYIISACKNTALNQIRNRNRRKETLVADWFDVPEDIQLENNPEMYVLQGEEYKMLAEVWDNLDERNKYLLRERYVLNRSYSEMAEELQVKPESVRMALTRARRTAAAQFQKKQ